MPKTILKIKTWVCHNCEYHQDCEPTKEEMTRLFGQEDDTCPSCKVGKLERETREEKKCTVTIMGEEEVEEMEVEDKNGVKDAEGKLPKRKLVKAEKDEMKAKIQGDIVKFREMEG